jgi:hypothetical protein
MKKVVFFSGIIFVPIIFIFLIVVQIEHICKPVNEYAQAIGTVETVGVTIETMQINSSFRRMPHTNQRRVFFVKLAANDTLYSFYRRDNKYEILINLLDKGNEVVM